MMPDAFVWQSAVPWLGPALAFGYLLGSIPFGLLIARLAGLGDIRKIGSGNIGATNVLRAGNRPLAGLTLLLDAIKGTVPVLIAGRYGMEAAMAAGFGAFVGHLFPIWLRFRGGKGVATYIGVLLALAWHGAVVFAAAWLAVAFTWRYSSLAALVAALVVPATFFLLGAYQLGGLFTLMSIIVMIRHHANIRRLMAGTETRIGARS